MHTTRYESVNESVCVHDIVQDIRNNALAKASPDTMAATAPPLCRSVYVSRIRRAFLLRVHPDRFRGESVSVQAQQSSITQAVANRFASPDFVSYCAPAAVAATEVGKSPYDTSFYEANYSFYLHRHDGTPSSHTIRLNESAEFVLSNIVHALKVSGVAGLPAPPPQPSSVEQCSGRLECGEVAGGSNSGQNGHRVFEFRRTNDVIWAASRPRDGNFSKQGINHRFDINTRRGRDLRIFLLGIDFSDIEKRKASRIDASAAALVARRAFGFQSIDGTGLGWSSASLAICLSKLSLLHSEHKTALNLDSFYPMRLEIGYDDESTDNIDLYGGVIRLHPSSTPLQWLESLGKITEMSLAELDANQAKLLSNAKHMQAMLNVKVKKGQTCPSWEYHRFVDRLTRRLGSPDSVNSYQSTALALERLQLVVETEQACRRAKINDDGTIRVGAGMKKRQLLLSLSDLNLDARQKMKDRNQNLTRLNEVIAMAQSQFGIMRIYREAKSTVTLDQMIECLARLLQEVPTDSGELLKLAGQSLGITGCGRFCHVADDGSFVIPCDWI